MYISDTPVDLSKGQDSPADTPKVIMLSGKPYWASVTSEAVEQKIKQLEVFIAEDLGEKLWNLIAKVAKVFVFLTFILIQRE